MSLNNEIERIINDAGIDFLALVRSANKIGPYKQYRRVAPEFGEFLPDNTAYSEYSYYDQFIKCNIRDVLLKDSLRELFIYIGTECIWPSSNTHFVMYCTEKYEDSVPFEFVLIKDGLRSGYRYSPVLESDISILKSEYMIDSIIQIEFSRRMENKNAENPLVRVISFGDFLHELLPEVDTNALIAKYKSIVKEAYDIVGFDTIHRFTYDYLSDFKDRSDLLLRSINFRELKYMPLTDKENKSFIGLNELDFDICRKRFVDRGMYKAMIGDSDFSRCFMTSEYLFQNISDKNGFDYTSIICGYLKTVEQLINTMISINLDYLECHDLWIKTNAKEKDIKEVAKKYGESSNDVWRKNPAKGANGSQIRFKQRYASYFDLALTPMIRFITDNKDGWYISDNGLNFVRDKLLNYASNCRNNYFHKDNIYDYSVVEKIRNNTILVVFLLLGSYRLSDDFELDSMRLGITDNSFDKLYKQLALLPRSVEKFIMEFKNGERLYAYRAFEQENPSYSSSGSLSDSRILFIQVENFDSNNRYSELFGQQERHFYLDKNNIPSYIAYINGRNEEKVISLKH